VLLHRAMLGYPQRWPSQEVEAVNPRRKQKGKGVMQQRSGGLRNLLMPAITYLVSVWLRMCERALSARGPDFLSLMWLLVVGACLTGMLWLLAREVGPRS